MDFVKKVLQGLGVASLREALIKYGISQLFKLIISSFWNKLRNLRKPCGNEAVHHVESRELTKFEQECIANNVCKYRYRKKVVETVSIEYKSYKK